MAAPSRPLNRDAFEIAILCALPVEFDAIDALFDVNWEETQSYGKVYGDPNAYRTGRIGNNDVVVAYLPEMGKRSAATTAAWLSMSFRNIKLGLVVGICGGVPFTAEGEEIVLGDIIISTGLIQYDYGRRFPNEVRRKDTSESNLPKPTAELRSFLRILGSKRGKRTMQDKTYTYIGEICRQEGFETSCYPGTAEDQLFEGTYRHKHQKRKACLICAACKTDSDPVCELAIDSSCAQLGCNIQKTLSRQRLHERSQSRPQSEHSSRHPKPRVHFGRIASGDMVMKSGSHRDQIAQTEAVIAFEMEGAGVWEAFPTIVIKAVCDYADSHKNKIWQQYAAAGAAACSKAFLQEWRSADKPWEIPANNVMTDLDPTQSFPDFPMVDYVMEQDPTFPAPDNQPSFDCGIETEAESALTLSNIEYLEHTLAWPEEDWPFDTHDFPTGERPTSNEDEYGSPRAVIQPPNPIQTKIVLDRNINCSGKESIERDALTILSEHGVDFALFGANATLFWAAEHGNNSVVDFALHQGAVLAATDQETGWTALHIACIEGHYEIVNKLIRLGASISTTDNDNAQPLHLAAQQGQTRCAEALLDEGASTEIVDNMDMTPLLVAVRFGHHEVVSLLVDRGANISVTLKPKPFNFRLNGIDLFLGDTALHVAAAIGDLATVKLLLSRGLGVDARSAEYDETALLIAAAFNHVNIIRELFWSGADVEAVTRKSGEGVVDKLLSSRSREKGDTEALLFLLENGLDVNALRRFGTALHAATERLDFNAIEMLLAWGARTDIRRPIDQFTPAELAQEPSYLARGGHLKDFSEYSKIAELLTNLGRDGG